MMQTYYATQFQQEETSRRDETYINPLPVRIWHWINALAFILLILTGFQIRYIGMLNVMSFETAVKMHNWVGFAAIANFLIWLGFYLLTDKIKVYHPQLDARKFFEGWFRQVRFYSYGIFKGEKSPHRVRPLDKFNPMQSMTYQIVMLLIVPVQFVTGILMWDIKRFEDWIEMLGGIAVVSTIHMLIFILFVSFILVHAYMGALGRKPSTHYKEMFTGYEEDD
jgi:Ni/Fe-hydrogenase b-type cytochrome subunit